MFNNNLYIETFNTDTLPLVTSLSQDFNRSTFETFDFDKLPGLVSMTQSFDNSNLKEVYISNHKKLSSINTGTFANCKNLKNITLNNNDQLTKINYAFKYSNNIETLVISNNDNLTTTQIYAVTVLLNKINNPVTKVNIGIDLNDKDFSNLLLSSLKENDNTSGLLIAENSQKNHMKYCNERICVEGSALNIKIKTEYWDLTKIKPH